MSIKADWDRPEIATRAPALPLAARVVIHRAGRLTASEIAWLDAADRSGAQARWVAWDLLRDALDRDLEGHGRRIAARNLAWQQVNIAAAAIGLDPVIDDGYWRAVPQRAAGAARLARFATCALIAPDLLEEDIGRLLIEPWRSVVG